MCHHRLTVLRFSLRGVVQGERTSAQLLQEPPQSLGWRMLSRGPLEALGTDTTLILFLDKKPDKVALGKKEFHRKKMIGARSARALSSLGSRAAYDSRLRLSNASVPIRNWNVLHRDWVPCVQQRRWYGSHDWVKVGIVGTGHLKTE